MSIIQQHTHGGVVLEHFGVQFYPQYILNMNFMSEKLALEYNFYENNNCISTLTNNVFTEFIIVLLHSRL